MFGSCTVLQILLEVRKLYDEPYLILILVLFRAYKHAIVHKKAQEARYCWHGGHVPKPKT